jgi:hypothetical protein
MRGDRLDIPPTAETGGQQLRSVQLFEKARDITPLVSDGGEHKSAIHSSRQRLAREHQSNA